MGTVDFFLAGLAAACTPENLLYALIGCVIGTALGVLPGIGATAGIAILIPITFGMNPTSAIIMLIAIYYGTTYGGTITSVLLNTPGEAESAVTCLDGYPMTRQGRAGAALTIAGVGSFVGGGLAAVGLVIGAQSLSTFGLRLGPPEFFALIVVGIALLAGLLGRSLVKGLFSATVGLVIAMVGIDPVRGMPRLTFGSENLLDGVSFVAVLVGIFGLASMLAAARDPLPRVQAPTWRQLLPTREDWRRSVPSIARGSAIGSVLGLVPGVTNTIASTLSYGAEKRFSKHRKALGTGAVEGVAGPEAANNAHSNGALIPLFTIGLPTSASLAVLMGAFLIHGLTPGPQLFVDEPDFVWTIIGSFFIANLVLLILNVPLVRIWTLLLRIPPTVLLPLVLAVMIVGAYASKTSSFAVWTMVVAGVVGLAFSRLDVPVAPLVLTMILGPLMEGAMRQSLEMSQGNFSIFFTRPIAAGLFALAAIILVGVIAGALRPARDTADAEA